MKKYYLANQLRFIVEIIYNPERLIWWKMESSELQVDIEKYLYGMVKKYKISEINNPFLKTMLNIWYKYRKYLSSSNSLFGLVTEIENFPVNMKVYVELFKEKCD